MFSEMERGSILDVAIFFQVCFFGRHGWRGDMYVSNETCLLAEETCVLVEETYVLAEETCK
jgi:hypothetical protein